jgi:hypothetical protein
LKEPTKSNNGAGTVGSTTEEKMKEKAKIRNSEQKYQMKLGWKSASILATVALLSACWGGFQGYAAQGNSNGAAGQMPAFYDGELFTVNMFEVPASDPIIGHNQSVNIIYATNDLDEEQDFAPVIDAIQGDGFNPLWLQVLIVFNPGFTPHQFVSDEEVEAAAAGANPEITLVVTDEIYRCSVVGKK